MRQAVAFTRLLDDRLDKGAIVFIISSIVESLKYLGVRDKLLGYS
jgi:hypothetical protein